MQRSLVLILTIDNRADYNRWRIGDSSIKLLAIGNW